MLNEKVDHIDIIVFSVLCLAISVILNKISIQSVNHIIWVSSLARLAPKGICDNIFESWFKHRRWYRELKNQKYYCMLLETMTGNWDSLQDLLNQ